MYDEKGLVPVICGGPGEKWLAEKVIATAPGLPWKNIIGKTTLDRLAGILSGSNAFIGNDSGTLHLAAAVGCPTVCIMGGGHFGRFFPYGDPGKNRVVYKKMDCFGCGWVCKYDRPRCIEQIAVEQVVGVIEETLKDARVRTESGKDFF
jgi:ADP-heptose:LPS heptosyltransferase